ncbi:hypothetical protein R3P38DRAFT_2837014 [Favolaschia claudopus]|uniref:Snurportin-1 n=1 Tax=Favolaschia claudopus TaxID=2862362 RepID=A0AAW0E307_9AGAR
MLSKDRKAAYKLPPAIAGPSESQELRRRKALDEQKRKRAQRVDSTRQLDLFADLNLGRSDDEDGADDSEVVRAGISPYASLLPSSSATPQAPEAAMEAVAQGKKKRKSKLRKGHNKWADRCMYAELLEMNEENCWDMSESGADGLPEDLETAWVAVGPVPLGKRCLAVTDQSLGVPGLVPNTSLRSRKLGKLLMPRFPSCLPASTVLDCILDARWKENGILHILDVLKWKGQDIAECETPFRFWWRDTRLGELAPSPPPSSSSYNELSDFTDSTIALPRVYSFPYPTKFLAVPYHSDTSLPTLVSHIIPSARASRLVDVDIPADNGAEPDQSMAVDQSSSNIFTTRSSEIGSDGLLLYVSEATYESGTSPLSSWIPLVKYGEDAPSSAMTESQPSESPLDIFLRLVQKRIGQRSDGAYNTGWITMDV